MIFLELFYTFFTIGLFTFGGGYAMLPLVQERVVSKGWLTAEQILDFIAVSESTPGPFAINISTYVGMEMGGLLGAAVATLGVVLPSFIIIIIVARCYEAFKESRIVSGCMSGLRPAVVGLIGAAVIDMAGKVLFPVSKALFPDGVTFAMLGNFLLTTVTSYWFIASVVIMAVMLVLVFKKAHPILVIVLSAVMGIGAGYIEKCCF